MGVLARYITVHERTTNQHLRKRGIATRNVIYHFLYAICSEALLQPRGAQYNELTSLLAATNVEKNVGQTETIPLSIDLFDQATTLVDKELIEAFYASDVCFLVISCKTKHLGKVVR
jgi:hypothetical protein